MITKQGIDISFAQGLDTKTDPKRVPVGKFLQLENTVFDKGGLLQKRNGYARLAALPDTTYAYLTTFNENLTAIGPTIAAYNAGANNWVTKGNITPLSIETLPVIRNNLNQTAVDTAIAPNGLALSVYLESDGTTTTNKYVVYDSITGQNLKAPAVIPVTSGAVSGGMRVYVLGQTFVMIFTNTIAAVAHLQYVTVSSIDPTNVGANTDIASAYISTTTLSWDAFVVNDAIFVAYNTTTGGQSIKVTFLTLATGVAAAATFATYKATIMSVTADMTTPASPVIYVSFYRSDTTLGYTLAVDAQLGTLMAPQQIISTSTYVNMTSTAQNGSCQVFLELSNGTNAGIVSRSVVLSGPTVTTLYTAIRGLGLGSKAFLIDGTTYFLGAYNSSYQPSYFLVNGTSSTQAAPKFVARLAYQNGRGWLTTGLPNVPVIGSTAWVSYLFKDLIQAANKNTNVGAGTQTAGIYSQTGANLASFNFTSDLIYTAEIGNDLNISGGMLWLYDGYLPTEQNFMLYPNSDQLTAVWAATGGSMAAKPDAATNTNAYFYQVTYEWTDNQGNAFRSAPSIPVAVTTTGAGVIGSVTVTVPALRVTLKTANPVKIVIYRWSVAQQFYYQTTSITAPTLNDTTADTITFLDTNADATILGNNLIYTTGGVIENVAPTATDIMTLFDTRLWLVDAEDRNLLWYSKQVIEATPVEMSDLLTFYIPPNAGTQASTGPIRTLAVMDDKLILGKKNAFLYINGSGPDNTGNNNQYSQPIFITSTVGCSNQKSIVLMPRGLMFQSDKGIWLLGRGLDTSYIGAPVQDFTLNATVTSAVTVPETNQVRFTLDSGVTLMYDYYYDQWGSFVGVPAVSSCIYNDLHTSINSAGIASQELPGTYLDGSVPVLIKFKTGPIRLGDLQNYQRAYFFYLLGTYLSPHKLYLSINYDYETWPTQSVLITPTNYSTAYGSGTSQSPYGQGSPYGGETNLEVWRIFLERQRCMSFGIALQEIFDASLGGVAGAGFTLSGINAVCAFKKAFRPQPNANSIG